MRKKHFDRYGPNACKIQALLNALDNLSPQDIERLESFSNRVDLFLRIASSQNLEHERPGAQIAAAEDAIDRVLRHDSTDLSKVIGSIAAALAVADRLPLRPFEDYDYIISRLIASYKPFQFYDAEDHAVEEFSNQLTLIEGHEVYVMSRPDDGGANGAELPDAIIKRGGKEYVLEHTAINSFDQQTNLEEKFKRSLGAAQIEEAVMAAHPGYGVNIVLPTNAFKTDKEIERFDFGKFKSNILAAVDETPVSRNAENGRRFDLPFKVLISRHRWGTYCHIIQEVPITKEALNTQLENEVVRAVNRKRKKLKAAQDGGGRTILLLDSEDYALLSHDAIVKAFGRVARSLDLTGIGEVFTIHNRGTTCWVLPAKIQGRSFPLLPQFRQFVDKRLEQYP